MPAPVVPPRPAACIGEDEGAVLVVGAAGNGRYVDLIVIIFALIVEVDPGLDCVSSPDLRHAIRDGVDRALRVRRIRTTGQTVEVRHCDSGDLLGCGLSPRNDIGKVDSQGTPVEAGQRRVDRDIHAVNTHCATQFVDEAWRDCPRPCEDVGLVGTIEVLARKPRSLIEGLIFKVGCVLTAKLNTVVRGWQEVNVDDFFALVNRVCCLSDPVLRSLTGNRE